MPGKFVTLLGGKAPPFVGRHHIDASALTVAIHIAQRMLSPDMAFFRSFAIGFDCGMGITGDMLAHTMEIAKFEPSFLD